MWGPFFQVNSWVGWVGTGMLMHEVVPVCLVGWLIFFRGGGGPGLYTASACVCICGFAIAACPGQAQLLGVSRVMFSYCEVLCAHPWPTALCNY